MDIFCSLKMLLLPEAKMFVFLQKLAALWFRYISVTHSFGLGLPSGIRSQSISIVHSYLFALSTNENL